MTDATGVRPLVMGDAPMLLKGILEKRFVWQELVADAAAAGSRTTGPAGAAARRAGYLAGLRAALLDALLEASEGSAAAVRDRGVREIVMTIETVLILVVAVFGISNVVFIACLIALWRKFSRDQRAQEETLEDRMHSSHRLQRKFVSVSMKVHWTG